MAVFETWLDQDLKKPVRIQYLSGNLFSQDNMGNLIGVNVTDDGAPATLGGSVSANVIRADGATVAVDTGVLSGNRASVTLPQAAYAVPGVITVVIKITSGTDVTTLAAVVTTVYRSSTDTIVDPGTIIPSIQALISQIETAVASIPSDYSSLWTTLAPAYSTSATYAVGQYVTYNGGLYRCTTAITSAESWTAAHWVAAKVGNDLSDLKSALTYDEYLINAGQYIIQPSDLENGYWQYSTKKTSTKRARNKTMFPVRAGMKITYANTTYDTWFGVLATQTASSYAQTIGWRTDGNGSVDITADGWLVFYICNHADSETVIDPSTYNSVVTIITAEKLINDGHFTAIETDIINRNTKVNTDIENLFDGTGVITIPQNTIVTEKKYIDDSGTIQNHNSYSVISGISLKTGETIVAITNSENHLSVIAKDNSGTYTPLVKATTTGVKAYSYQAEENVSVALSINPSDYNLFYIRKVNINEVEEKANASYDALSNAYSPIVGTDYTGKQAQRTGTKVVLNNGTDAYKVFEASVNEFDFLRIDCYAGSNDRYAVGFFFCDDDDTILYQYNQATSGRVQLEVVAPIGTKKVVVNGYNFVPYAKAIYKTSSPIRYTSLALFSKFGVIGDSYASGELYYNSDYHDKYNISWGQILARKLGTTCTNYSRGGLTTRSWLTNAKGLPLILSSPAEDIYYCALGINDVYSLGPEYLGSSSDLKDDYTDIPSTDYDTFYGNYGRIITQVKAYAPHAKIVMFTCAATTGNYPMFNSAIIAIAKYYNIPYIVQAEDPFFQTDVYTMMAGGHPTAIGYSGMAEAFERLLNRCIVENRPYFADAFMY